MDSNPREIDGPVLTGSSAYADDDGGEYVEARARQKKVKRGLRAASSAMK
jgi:hypothetical protein